MPPVMARGDIYLLEGRLIGFFGSQSMPGDAVLSTHDLAVALRESNATFIGGFQSPMKREFLTLPAAQLGRGGRMPDAEHRTNAPAGGVEAVARSQPDARAFHLQRQDAPPLRQDRRRVQRPRCRLGCQPVGTPRRARRKVESVCEAALAAGKPVLTRPGRPDDDQLREARDLHLYALREKCEREDFGEPLEDRI